MKYDSIDDIVRDLEANPIERTGHIYHPIPFAEFDHLTPSVNRESVEAKLRLVRSVRARRLRLGLPADSVLDIGANGGLFAFSLAADGARVTAFEPDPRYSEIGAFLSRHRATSVEWHGEPFTAASMRDRNWDMALLLSTFQWISDGDAQLDDALSLLRELSERTSCLIFELGLNSGKSAITTTKINHVAAVYDLIRSSTAYPHVRLASANRLWPVRAFWRGWRFTFVCSHDDPRMRQPPYAVLKNLPF